MNGYTAEGQQNMRLGWKIFYKRKYQCPNLAVVQTILLIIDRLQFTEIFYWR